MNSPTFAELSKEEYLYFCDLIISGSEMANYLLHSKSASKTIQEHALYWQLITKKFKPMIRKRLRMTA